jgi:hypothetical protein
LRVSRRNAIDFSLLWSMVLGRLFIAWAIQFRFKLG